jgi:[protein-PII] uridylyltransferase
MNSGSRLRPAAVAAKERLIQGRETLKSRHASGSPGVEVCARVADLLDAAVLELHRAALEELGAEAPAGLAAEVALAALGGYGRRDVAPYSDVDLMLLHEPGAADRVAPLARRLTCSLYDAGLQLSFSVRTPSQACTLAMKNPTIFTSLVEARYLTGSVRLFAQFVSKFRRAASRRARFLIARVEQSRRDERWQYGETVYLLNPNVKRSPGALRDLQLARWVGFARYGEAELDDLLWAGAISKEDHQKLGDAREFLLRLRNELHFHAGRPQDVLDMDEQLRIAQRRR